MIPSSTCVLQHPTRGKCSGQIWGGTDFVIMGGRKQELIQKVSKELGEAMRF